MRRPAFIPASAGAPSKLRGCPILSAFFADRVGVLMFIRHRLCRACGSSIFPCWAAPPCAVFAGWALRRGCSRRAGPPLIYCSYPYCIGCPSLRGFRRLGIRADGIRRFLNSQSSRAQRGVRRPKFLDFGSIVPTLRTSRSVGQPRFEWASPLTSGQDRSRSVWTTLNPRASKTAMGDQPLPAHPFAKSAKGWGTHGLYPSGRWATRPPSTTAPLKPNPA